MSKVLESAILRSVPDAERVEVIGDFAFVKTAGSDTVTRYRLSPEAQRVALLEREVRPRDIRRGEVLLLPPTGE